MVARWRITFDRERTTSYPRRLDRNAAVYMEGDQSNCVYFIDSGRVKLLTLSPTGKECLLAVHTTGDILGEVCAGLPRCETAIAMESSCVRSMPQARFLASLERDALLGDFVRHLAQRIARQQRIITSLVTVDSEHRLGETLLFLAETLGGPQPSSRRIAPALSHEELAQMIGTTRPRVTSFMGKFRALGLVATTRERHLIVNVEKLTAHLGQAPI